VRLANSPYLIESTGRCRVSTVPPLLTLAGAFLGVVLRALAEGPRALTRAARWSWLTGAIGGLLLGAVTGAVLGRAIGAGTAAADGSAGGVLLSAGLFGYCVVGAAVWRLARQPRADLLRDAVVGAVLALVAATGGVLLGLAVAA
jgi:hypothetical protein